MKLQAVQLCAICEKDKFFVMREPVKGFNFTGICCCECGTALVFRKFKPKRLREEYYDVVPDGVAEKMTQ